MFEIVDVFMGRRVWQRTLKNAQFLVVCVLAHSIH